MLEHDECLVQSCGVASRLKPEWKNGSLSQRSREGFSKINLHFHDLRREAGSRLIEGGWPIHHVKEMLGHANLEQTSTYVNVIRAGLKESMERFSRAKSCIKLQSTTRLSRKPMPEKTPQPLIS